MEERTNKCIDQGEMYFLRIKINYVYIRSYVCFITVV
jgi:hypothetical protein